MIRVNSSDLNALDRFKRANLINCLSGTKPAVLVGTRSAKGVDNLALFSNLFHLGADPAMIGLVQRPLTDLSHTYKNMVDTGWFTVNHFGQGLVKRAHHTSAKFSDGISEFVACGIDSEFFSGIPAPFVRESRVRFSARFIRDIAIEENNTRIVIAQVDAVFIDDGLLLSDGNIAFSEDVGVAAVGLESYYSVGLLSRFEYAKPGTPPTPKIG